MTILVQELKAENAAFRAEIDRLTVEIERHRAMLIEREATRIAQSLGQHDDQKWLDELLARGIQQDKDEIARLKAENARLLSSLKLCRTALESHAGRKSSIEAAAFESAQGVIAKAMAKEQP